MMNPTTLTFERDYNSYPDNCIYCKMVVRVEETDVEVYYMLTDENGLHRYKSTHSGIKFTSSFVSQFAEQFTAYAFADGSVTTDGWACVRELELQLSDIF